MDGFDLPMSFGKKSKNASVNVKAKLQETKRAEVVGAPAPHIFHRAKVPHG